MESASDLLNFHVEPFSKRVSLLLSWCLLSILPTQAYGIFLPCVLSEPVAFCRKQISIKQLLWFWICSGLLHPATPALGVYWLILLKDFIHTKCIYHAICPLKAYNLVASIISTKFYNHYHNLFKKWFSSLQNENRIPKQSIVVRYFFGLPAHNDMRLINYESLALG